MAKIELTLEEQIAALNKQLNDLTAKSKQNETTIADQKGQLTTQGKELAAAIEARDQAQRDLAEKVDTIRALESQAEANEVVIAGYEAQLRKAAAQGKGGAPVVDHEGQLYRVVVPKFAFGGKLVTAESLKTDASLVKELVQQGSGVLVLVEDDEEQA